MLTVNRIYSLCAALHSAESDYQRHRAAAARAYREQLDAERAEALRAHGEIDAVLVAVVANGLLAVVVGALTACGGLS
jgi:hypothetical protein